jgi:hypothetical protein
MGKSTSVHRCGIERPQKIEDWQRTCPQYFAQSPFVTQIMDDLEDYRNNRLGDVRDFPLPLLHYLRFADREQKSWDAWWEAELMAKEMAKHKR